MQHRRELLKDREGEQLPGRGWHSAAVQLKGSRAGRSPGPGGGWVGYRAWFQQELPKAGERFVPILKELKGSPRTIHGGTGAKRWRLLCSIGLPGGLWAWGVDAQGKLLNSPEGGQLQQSQVGPAPRGAHPRLRQTYRPPLLVRRTQDCTGFSQNKCYVRVFCKGTCLAQHVCSVLGERDRAG